MTEEDVIRYKRMSKYKKDELVSKGAVKDHAVLIEEAMRASKKSEAAHGPLSLDN